MGYSRQEYWNGFPCSPPEDLPDPGTVPAGVDGCRQMNNYITVGGVL